MRTWAEFQKYNFFRSPQWRWDRVLKLCDRPNQAGRCTRRDDAVVREGRNFLLAWRKATDPDAKGELFWKTPGLYYAFELHEREAEDPESALFIQARLLARQTPEQIAQVMSTHPSAVKWYEALFFNVSDRLDQRDWITKQVLLPAYRNANGAAGGDAALPFRDSSVARPFMDASLKLFAYFGGTHLVDVMIAGLRAGKPLTSPDDLSNWLDQTWSTTVRRRSAQAAVEFEVNKYNVMELFTVHSRIVEIERSEDSQDRQRSTHERAIEAMLGEIPFAVGDDGRKLVEGSKLKRFDEGAAELRDDEVLLVAAGHDVEGLDDSMPARLPPPRKRVAAGTDLIVRPKDTP
jgi:hypothetical protein